MDKVILIYPPSKTFFAGGIDMYFQPDCFVIIKKKLILILDFLNFFQCSFYLTPMTQSWCRERQTVRSECTTRALTRTPTSSHVMWGVSSDWLWRPMSPSCFGALRRMEQSCKTKIDFHYTVN